MGEQTQQCILHLYRKCQGSFCSSSECQKRLMAETQQAFTANISHKERISHLSGLFPSLAFITVICVSTRICSHIPHLLLVITKWRHNAEFITSHSLALQQSLVKITELWPPCGIKQKRKGMGKNMPLLYTKSAVRCTENDFLKRRLAFPSTPTAE